MSLVVVVAIACCAIGIYCFHLRSLRSFPPGPRGLPFIGCILSLPKEKEWLTYARWIKKYGDIIGLNVAGRKIVVLNTPELATGLLGDRGWIYSDRPRIPMLDMLGLSDWSVGLMPYGPKLHMSRKLLIEAMTPQVLQAYVPIHECEVYKFLQDLLVSPNSFRTRMRRAIGGIMLCTFIGRGVKSDDDHYMRLNDELVAITARASTFTGYLVNTVTALRYLPSWAPGARFQREAKEGRQFSKKIYESTLQLAQQRINEGNAVPCFMNSILESGENIEEGQGSAATAYGAGTDTAIAVLMSFVLAMTIYPKIQQRAQAEIIQAIGEKRLPRLDDKEKVHLPFIDALIKEVYRWNPPVNIGVPHCVMRDDEAEGYLLPRGTIVLANVWAILHDEKRYPQPFDFRPERYMVQHPPEDPREHVFGYGRRACPGRNLADATVWLTIVSLLSAFNFMPETDEHNKIIPVTPDYTSGAANHPKSFGFRIKARDAELPDILMQTLAEIENLESP